ncbi:hypothetical protein GCM10018785_68540 [Streptomyces longispororuber]|uniref:Uncharacterized protein n=1 Tax=Streptomyces longispororuber TaxID=68230 RepID=A0A919DZ34_9ACTN|nr:hypothetical protein GCM10018785_68540 [Streptomyces longispororuber]
MSKPKRWQNRYVHLHVDGAVGPKTFFTAGWGMNLQEDRGSAEYMGPTAAGGYTGRGIGFVRGAAGEWAMYLDGDLRRSGTSRLLLTSAEGGSPRGDLRVGAMPPARNVPGGGSCARWASKWLLCRESAGC